MSKVLVTGGSGFVAAHCLLQLLAAGHEVRATLRSQTREPGVRAMMHTGGVAAGDRLSFTVADLAADAGWPEAVAGCDYVLHVASPFPANVPKHEDEIIVPAVQGTLRVLRAARAAGVKRVVVTSSFAAIGYGRKAQHTTYDETDWTDPQAPGLAPYVKSKTLAERAAWDFISADGGGLELAVVNPVGVLGPALGPDFSTSILLLKRLMDGDMPGCPRLSFGLVDARDVAGLHLRAMTDPAAKGERFLAVAGDFVAMIDIAKMLRERLGGAAERVPLRQLPDWLVRLVALGDPTIRAILPELGKMKNASNEKAKRLLGWAPRSNEQTVVETAESLVRLGLLKNGPGKAA